ncbi:hypothetical protein FXO38_15737 [Capsicum annuum]|nr:hypothetical protein FXO38_15737 [Capsicum annuum]
MKNNKGGKKLKNIDELKKRTNTINGTVTAVKKLQLSDTPSTFSKVDESRPSTNDYNVSVHRAPIPTDDLQISEEIPPDLAEEEHQRKGKGKATAETWAPEGETLTVLETAAINSPQPVQPTDKEGSFQIVTLKKRVVKERMQRKAIRTLTSLGGSTLTKMKDIKEEIISFYKGLMGSATKILPAVGVTIMQKGPRL